MTQKENEPAVSAKNLEATRIVNITNLDRTQIVNLEDLKEMDFISSLSANAAAAERGRSTLLQGAVLGLLLAVILTAALLAAHLPQNAALPAARTGQSKSH